MSATPLLVDVPAEEERVKTVVKHLANGDAAIRWLFSSQTNERFPLRLYASARQGEGSTARDAVVIAIEIYNPADAGTDKLIVSADIMDEDAGILSQSPRYDVPLSPANDGNRASAALSAAMQDVARWLDREASTIQAAISEG